MIKFLIPIALFLILVILGYLDMRITEKNFELLRKNNALLLNKLKEDNK